MNITPIPAAAFDMPSPAMRPVVDTLQAVLLDVDTFLVDWFQRLDQQLQATESSGSIEASLQAEREGFQREKNEWALKRDREEAQIQEKAEQLTQAWLRLEAEQRTLLQLKNATVSTVARSSEAAAIPAVNTDHPKPQRPLSEATASHTGSNLTSPAIPSRPPRSSENAIRQFQKLQKEIQSNRR